MELSKVITPENLAEVLPRFFHASKQEAKAVTAELRPVEAAPHREVVTVARPVPAARAAADSRLPEVAGAGGRATAPVSGSAVHPANLPKTRDDAEPLTGELRRLHVTVSKRFLEKLAKARDALSHSHPDASTEAVLEAALDLLLVKKDGQKGLVKKPRTTPARPSGRPRHIPAEVKRAVWARDAGRCQWPVESGGICGSTRLLDLDHVVPVARGGTSSVENLRVVCRCHNQLAASRIFGEAWMERFTADGRGRAAAAPSPPC